MTPKILTVIALATVLLDGTEWKMRYRAADAWLPIWKADVMRFEQGVFRSQETSSYGFQETAYGADGRVWKAAQFNPDGERADWEGVLEGDRMDGTFIWSRPDGTVRKYSFSAERR